MNVDTMRKVDYFAGVPLTLLATLLLKLKRAIAPTPAKKARNVLFVELSEMGSAILVDPAMRQLKAQEGITLHFVIFKKNKPSLQLLNTIDEENIFTIDESSLFSLAQSTFAFIRWCRHKRIDSVIDLELFSRFTALLTFASGATNRVGYYSFHNEGLYRGELLTHKVAYNPHQHITKNFIALTDALQSTTMQTPFSKRIIGDDELTLAQAKISPEAITRVQEAIKTRYDNFQDTTPIILINSNASDLLPQRRWDKKNYCELITMILEQNSEALVLLTGAPMEYDGAQELVQCVQNPRCVNFSGAVKFLDLPALYSLSEFMVSNDSGPAHFAAITSMHTYIIYGPETPALYGSLGPSTAIYAQMSCSPCVSASNHRKTPCSDNQCIQVITAKWVFDVIYKQLASI